MHDILTVFTKNKNVGCVPSVTVAVGGGGGVSAWGCLPRVCVSARGLCQPRGCVSEHALGREVSAPMHAGIHTPAAQCMLGYTPPCEQND